MSLLLCAILLIGSTSSMASAKVESEEPIAIAIMPEEAVKPLPVSMTSGEPTEKALEEAIIAVKQKINIPEEYSEFNYSYHGSNSYSGVYWSLNWRKPTEYSYIDVSLDKDNNFISYSSYDSTAKYRSIPSSLKDELQDEAEAFIKKIAPDIYRKVEFVNSSYDGNYSNSYTYYYQRKENDIIFPDNTLSVRVDASSGEIRYASINWLRGAKIPSEGVKLTKEDAAKLIGDNLKMKLSYKTNYYRIYDNGQSDYVKKAFLVYEPELPYISIDANTGDVYLTRSEWVEMDFGRLANEDEKKSDMEADAGSVNGSVSLTEEEISKLRELEELITKDEAIKKVTSNKYLHIDENLITYTANLTQSYSTKTKKSSYVWNISLRDNRPVDYNKNEDNYRAYAYASVDAKSGKILSFNASVKNNYYDSITGKWVPIDIYYSKEKGQSIFEKFVESQARSRFKKTKLVEQTDDYVAYFKDGDVPVYGGYSYRYNRFNEGVEFPYNGIYGSVDGVTGKIYYFNTNWDDDIVFESPKDAMTPEQAFDYYISKDGFNLLYEVNVINQYYPNYKSEEKYYDYSEAYRVAYKVRLVYRPDINPSYISPYTGEQLDYQGEVYKVSEPYLYKDISNTVDNREILLLADMNIGFEGENFEPDKYILEGEINQLFEKLGYWSSYSEAARESTKVITKEELAYNFISRLGLEKMAKLSGIYKTGYIDEGDINPDYYGAVALAKGLELFPDYNSQLFNPKKNISRREAVSMIFSFIKAETEGDY